MPEDPPPDRNDGFGELELEALEVLRDAASWHLTGSRWRVVSAAVTALADARRAGDVVAFRRAIYDLELAGPVRGRSADDPPPAEVPPLVREEITDLILTLDGTAG